MSSSSDNSVGGLSWVLQTRIRPVASSLKPGVPFAVDVIVRNSLDHPVTVLTWDSPLDPKAGLLGIFQARDVEEENLIQGDFLRLRRKMPPSKESFLEIGGKKQVRARVTLPGLQLSVRTEYAIECKGRWQAVWCRPMAEIDESLLESLTEAHLGEVLCESEIFEVEDESSGSE